ncbi:hypothetical protein A2899_01195 [Candidatus Amesbacteria bacterium RIFCSPLOWO2_01_FULL_49_25]|uniref:ComEC/Rec2-related protein domain-containing protein n=1 Tax=Candidatus Amesbacteria bacterium RIFCSPHIGHO2_01_FULL_48_32b TaxID=1797253 RepID=A0A1F4YHD1_9BACT|nr:MAG: hypothetical protein A2876_03040 [Candidatus Amesbacteria bacterium RIFCSPHIGHO2_01_FULL_48_32b]OGD07768.1 MAG: hypothetical protein A2899_01195 [Candidatus Amesbacteria bacterium RIFCSPLOWO2_01_FULL_49_25]
MRRGLVVSVMLVLILARYELGQRNRVDLGEGMTVKVTGRVGKFYGKNELEVEGVRVKLKGGEEIQTGDKIIMAGKLEKRLIGEKTEGLVLIYDRFEKVGEPYYLLGMVTRIREGMVGKLHKWLPGDEGGLAAGILLGGDGDISWRAKENFKRTGLTHVVAASGYNVSVVVGAVLYLSVILVGRKWGLILSIGGVVFYTVLAGMTAAVVRAGLMAISVIVGQMVGRKADKYWILAIVGWLMLMWDPGYLADIGWQLSMAATVGVLWSMPEVFLTNNRMLSFLGGDLKTTLAAQIMTMPIILHHFGQLSVVAPVANLLVLPVVPIVMGIVGAAATLGVVWYDAGMILSWLAWPWLRYMTGMTEWWAGLPWAAMATKNIGWGGVGWYYLAVILIYKCRFLIFKQKD